MAVTRSSLICFVLLAGLVQTAWPQRASIWRSYKGADGLPESTVVAVSVSFRGHVWANHPRARQISRLDGYGTSSIPAPAVAHGQVDETPGGQVWATYPGGLLELRDQEWVQHPIPGRGQPRGLAPIRFGRVLVLFAASLVEFNSEWPERPEMRVIRTAEQNGLGAFTDMIVARDGGLWIGGRHALAKIPGPLRAVGEAEWQEHRFEAFENLRKISEDDSGGITGVAVRGEKQESVVARFHGGHWSIHEVPGEPVRQAWFQDEETFWCLLPSGLVLLDTRSGRLQWADEVVDGRIWGAAVERQGVFWLATSEGLFRHAPAAWRTPEAGLPNVPVYAAVEDGRGHLWFAAGSSVLKFDGTWSVRALPVELAPMYRSAACVYLDEPDLLVLDAGGQLIVVEQETGEVRAGPPAKLLGPFDRSSVIVLRQQNERADGPALERFDGRDFQPFIPVPSEAGEELFFVRRASTGDLWAGGNDGVARWREGQWETFSGEETSPDGAFCFLEFGGRIWIGGRDRVWEFDGRSWSVIQGGLDRVHDLTRTRDEAIWAASNSGLYRFMNGAWIQNSAEEGLVSEAVYTLLEDRRGGLWAATARGISRYFPEADIDPPRTSVRLAEDIAGEQGTRTLWFSATDRWKFTPAERLLFSHRLNEADWSPWEAERSVSFYNLPAGTHYFQVRAIDRNWNIEAEAALLEFIVPVPWHKETRLIIVGAIAALAVLFFGAVAINRHIRLRRSYAEVERLVALRTAQLEKANQELLHSQKMTALGTLAAGIAHDFNNILSIIKGSVQIIETNPGNTEKIRTRSSRIKTVVDQGAGIVKAMLGFSRVRDGQPVVCDLNEIVRETIQLLGDGFSRDVKARFEPAEKLPPVALTKEFVQQILLNLVFNAADAMGGRGHVLVWTAEAARPDTPMSLQPRAAAHYAGLFVQDSGCGIAPELMPRIFEPFFTTKGFSARRGTGLGLSMVYQLAQEMGCGLHVASTVGKGTTFAILFPVTEGTPSVENQPAVQQATSGERT